LGILVGISLPSLITWGYFVAAADYPQGWQQSIYLIVKVCQFAFPVVWACLVLGEAIRIRRPTVDGVVWGLAFGLVVVAAGWATYMAALRGLPVFQEASAAIAAKVRSFGIDSIWKYAVLAGFYSLIHSLLEEYYWRWFVFGQLRRVVPTGTAMVLSAIAFASHHVIVLAKYFGGSSPLTWLFSAAIVVGGLFWAWLYEKTGSLVAPWLSHLVIDAGIFWIGYELVRGGLGAGG
jgi:membrane protease YdiL (CAAX protease family)